MSHSQPSRNPWFVFALQKLFAAFGTTNHIRIVAFWMVSDDQSIHRIEGEDIDGYGFVDMEVSSRILLETDFAEVEKVYSLIQNNIRTQVNSSCGLHYHIGIGHLSLESVKKLVTLVMVAEDRGLFRRICARHRSSPTNLWCQPVSEFSRAAMRRDGPPRLLLNRNLEYHLPQRHEISRDLLLALSQIWDCGDVDGIAEQTLTCNSRPSAAYGFSRPGGFAIRRLKVEPDIEGNLVNSDRTIEFRYKESTGSALEDYHWLQLCLQLVRVTEWSYGRFRAVMGTFSTTDALDGLLLALGMGSDEVQWWLTIAERHRAHQNPVKRSRFLVPENVSTSGLV